MVGLVDEDAQYGEGGVWWISLSNFLACRIAAGEKRASQISLCDSWNDDLILGLIMMYMRRAGDMGAFPR